MCDVRIVVKDENDVQLSAIIIPRPLAIAFMQQFHQKHADDGATIVIQEIQKKGN